MYLSIYKYLYSVFTLHLLSHPLKHLSIYTIYFSLCISLSIRSSQISAPIMLSIYFYHLTTEGRNCRRGGGIRTRPPIFYLSMTTHFSAQGFSPPLFLSISLSLSIHVFKTFHICTIYISIQLSFILPILISIPPSIHPICYLRGIMSHTFPLLVRNGESSIIHQSSTTSLQHFFSQRRIENS